MLDSKYQSSLLLLDQKTAERDTILSPCTGAVGDVVLTIGALIILYAVIA